MRLNLVITDQDEIEIINQVANRLEGFRDFYDIKPLPASAAAQGVDVKKKPFFRRAAFWGGVAAGGLAVGAWMNRNA